MLHFDWLPIFTSETKDFDLFDLLGLPSQEFLSPNSTLAWAYFRASFTTFSSTYQPFQFDPHLKISLQSCELHLLNILCWNFMGFNKAKLKKTRELAIVLAVPWEHSIDRQDLLHWLHHLWEIVLLTQSFAKNFDLPSSHGDFFFVKWFGDDFRMMT